jgi:alpha-beta hydrolase superfamily lysophospholipase
MSDRQSWAGALLTTLGGALDSALLRGMSLAYHEALSPPFTEYERLRGIAEECAKDGDGDRPQHFLRSAIGERRTPGDETVRPLPGGQAVTRRFRSGYVPYRTFHGDDASGSCVENDSIWVEHWMHHGRPRGALLALHGFTMGSPRIDAHVLMASQWYGAGFDVALMTLPFHGARASATCRYSGERFASWHAGRLNEAVRQSVHDASIVVRWLAETRDAPIGVLGVSLGGYVASLLASCETELAFVVPIVPAVCLADLPSRLFPLSRSGRAGLQPPLTVAELREAYRAHSPLSHRLAVPRARVFIVAARADGITLAWHARRLWEHWERPESLWFNGGHVSPFHRSSIVTAIQAHLDGALARDHATGVRVLPSRAAAG